MPKCPICTVEDDTVSIAIHLMTAHDWPYEKGHDWLETQTEADVSAGIP